MRKKELRRQLADCKYALAAAQHLPPKQDNAKKFTPEEADEIRHIAEHGKHTRRELAEILDVHPSTISRIVNRKAYR